MTQVTTYIGIGANLGDARVAVVSAIGALADLPQTQLQAQSRLYTSAPMGLNSRNARIQDTNFWYDCDPVLVPDAAAATGTAATATINKP